MDIDTKALIAEVEKRPHIWNPSHPDYRLREARIESWSEICSNLVENFETFDAETQEEIMNRARTRWKTARDSYVKIENKHKTLGTTRHVNKYNYLDQLEFIKQIDKKKPRLEYERESPNDAEDESSQEEVPTMLKQEEVHIKSEDGVKKSETSMTSSQQEATGVLNADSSNHDEDDRDFLISLLPTLRRFDDDQKLTFRLEMLQMMMRMKSSAVP